MSLSYNIYVNDHAGGPVNLATPLATTASPSYLTAALAYPSDTTFLVRTLDLATGFEDLNSDALARLVLDASGADVTNRPAPPSDLSATPIEAGGLLVEWAYLPVPGMTLPSSFSVWAQVGAINYALTPSATTAYDPGQVAFSAEIPALTDGATYTVGVRAVNASGAETNTTTTTATADATGPDPVDGLVGTATF